MAHSYITKLYMLFYLFFFNLFALFLVRLNSLEKILNILKKIKINRKKEFTDLNFLLKYHLKIIKILSLKKCLTTSVAIFCSLRSLGFAANINISIAREGGFYSHSWVSVNGKDYFKDKDELIDIITIG